MTIHHDKLAYGRLKGLSEELSAEDILKLVEEANEDSAEEENKEESKKENSEACGKKVDEKND